MIRIPGVCNFNAETTVLAHYRHGGTGGMGLKPPDLLGAWSCSSCHDVVDGRCRPSRAVIQSWDTLDWQFTVKAWHAEGVMRTLYQLWRLGIIKGVK
jgi:hypothetical protein